MTYSSEVLADSPWGFWRLNETVTAALANDGSGSDFTLEAGMLGTATLVADGGSSIAGLSGVDIATSSIPGSLAGASVSFECWVDIPAANVRGPFMGVGTYGSNGWAVGVGGTTMDNDGHQLILLHEAVAWKPTGHTLSTGTHHIVVTRSSADLFTCYVDGVSVYSSTFTPNAPTGSLHVGGSGNAARILTSTVAVDNVAMFAAALSSARVTAHYASGSGDNAAVAADSPVVFLKCDDPGFADSSGNARPLGIKSPGSLTADQSGPVFGGEAVAWSTSAGYLRTAETTSTAVGTLEAWVYLTENPASTTAVVAAAPTDGSANSNFSLSITSAGKPRLGVYTGIDTSIEGASALSLNTWHHIVGSVGAAGSRLRVDKVTVNTSGVTSFTTQANALWVRGVPGASAAGAMVIAEPALYTTQLTTTRTDAHYDAASSGALSGEPFTSSATFLDGTAQTALRVSGEPFAVVSTFLDGGGLPTTIAGEAFTSTTTMLDGSAQTSLLVAGESWSATAAMLDGYIIGSDVPGEAFGVTVVMLDGSLLFATDTSNGFSGRIRGGSATVEITVPVATIPATLVRGHRYDKAIALAEPTMIDGRPT